MTEAAGVKGQGQEIGQEIGLGIGGQNLKATSLQMPSREGTHHRRQHLRPETPSIGTGSV